MKLVAALRRWLPEVSFDADAVAFGAARHDIGKALHPAELEGPGNEHEVDGPSILERFGVSRSRSRFARTHGTWRQEAVGLEDLLAALADCIWKGRRDDGLEHRTTSLLAEATGTAEWRCYMNLDEILTELAAKRRRAARLAAAFLLNLPTDSTNG